MGVKFLEAFVEFIARGHETVIDQAKQIESKLAGINTGKLGEVKFTASGADKVEGAVSSIKQKLTMLAQGGDITRMLSSSIEDAFKTAGEGVGGALASTMGGLIGGAIGASIGAQLSGLVMKIPETIGKEVEVSREAAILSDRSLSPEEAEQWKATTGPARAFWSGSPIDKDSYEKGLRIFQTTGPAPSSPAEAQAKIKEAEAAMNQIMALGTGAPEQMGDVEGFARRYARMLTTHRGREKRAMLSDPLVMDAVQKRFSSYTTEQIEAAAALDDNKAGALTTRDISEAIGEAARDPRVIKGVESKMKENRWQRYRETHQLYQGENQLDMDEVQYVNQLKRGGKESMSPTMYPMNVLKPEQIEKLDKLAAAQGTADKPADLSVLPGLNGAAPPAEHALSGGKGMEEFAFTSLSGLAEKMQQEAAGGMGDIQDRQLAALEKIAANTAKESKTPDAAPQPRVAW
jgi:hypothetical protein